MAISNLANNAAAVAAGYKQIQIDRGASASPRYITRYEQAMTGAPGDSGGLLIAEGGGDNVQATADANALAALNNQRKHHFGGAPSRPDGAANSPTARGGSHTDDKT